MARPPKQFLAPEDWSDFRERYESSDDRSCAILCAAYLDDCLDVLVRSALMGNNDAKNRLFSDMMPLSSFSAKINIAFCLSLIHDTVYDDLHRIRRIRNEFAHRIVDLNFSVEPVQSLCFALVFPREYLDSDELSHLSDSPREYFIFTCAMFSAFFEGQYLQRADKLKELLGDLEQLASITSRNV